MDSARDRWPPALAGRRLGKPEAMHKREALPGGAFQPGTVTHQPRSAEDFEAALSRAESGGADVLQIWTDYVMWAQRWPSAEKIVLLRRAVSSLSLERLHLQDIRLLRLWVMLADKDSRPTDIFQQLEDRGIGTHHALLYEAWAHCLETRRDFDGAADVYRRGLRSLAQPQARLRARRADFDERMRQRVSRLAARHSEPGNKVAAGVAAGARRLTHFRIRTSLVKHPTRAHVSELRARLSPQKRQERRKSLMDRRRRSVLLRPKPRLPKEPARLDAATFRGTQATLPMDEVAVQSIRPSSRQAAPRRFAAIGEEAAVRSHAACRTQGRLEPIQQIRKRPLEPPRGQLIHKEQEPPREQPAKRPHTATQAGGVYSRYAADASNPPPEEPAEAIPPMPAHEPEQPKAPPRKGIFSGWLAPWTGMFQRDEEEDLIYEDAEECSEGAAGQMQVQERTPAKHRKGSTWFGW